MDVTDKQIIDAINVIAATDEGRIVLNYLKEVCFWDMTVVNPSNPNETLYHSAKRGVYGTVRAHIRPEHLKVIEHDIRRKINDRGNAAKHKSRPSE